MPIAVLLGSGTGHRHKHHWQKQTPWTYVSLYFLGAFLPIHAYLLTIYMTGQKRNHKNPTDKSTNSTDSTGGTSGYPVVLLVVWWWCTVQWPWNHQKCTQRKCNFTSNVTTICYLPTGKCNPAPAHPNPNSSGGALRKYTLFMLNPFTFL